MAENLAPELIPPVPAPVQEGVVVPSDSDTLPTVVVAETAPPPFGRTWAFDTEKDEFVRAGAQGPRAIYGPVTVVQWIDKALRTERGALPIHPPGYGLEDPSAIFGRPIAELSVQELERQISDCLTFHPRIAAVVGLQLREEAEAAFASYQVQLDPPLDEVELLALRLDLGVI